MTATVIEFTVPCVPVAQPRPRAVVRRGANGKTFAGVHNPHTVKDASTGKTKPHPAVEFKATIRMAAQAIYQSAPLEGPLRVDVLLIFPRPRSKVWKTKPMPRYWHQGKPDRDNADKAVLDALTGLLWRDDCQVCSGQVQKFVAAGDEQPHVRIRVQALNET